MALILLMIFKSFKWLGHSMPQLSHVPVGFCIQAEGRVFMADGYPGISEKGHFRFVKKKEAVV